MFTRAFYRLPYIKDEGGCPKIKREMTEHQYSDYSFIDQKFENMIKENSKENFATTYNATLDMKKLPLIQDECDAMYYGEFGKFIIVTYNALKYFGVDVTIDDLVRIALWGDWYCSEGTNHHYIDVVCSAYGMYVTRVTALQQIAENISSDKGFAIAMLDKKAIPEATESTPVIITEISNGEVYFCYLTENGNKKSHLEASDLLKYTKTFWTIL